VNASTTLNDTTRDDATTTLPTPTTTTHARTFNETQAESSALETRLFIPKTSNL